MPGAGGAPCLTYVTEPAFNLQSRVGYAGDDLGLNLYGAYPLCPAAPGAPAPQVDPAALAEQFWQTIPLPFPRPSIPPGYAVTGKTAYLVTGGTTDPPPFTEPTPLGELAVTATGSYTVAWGDGTTSGPFATGGGPYPDGTITHTYDDTADLTVTVTETWSATWSIGEDRGVLGQLHTVATIPGFDVRQIQAIVSQQ